MEVLTGRRTAILDDDRVAAAADHAERVVVDVGTGDGREALRLAREHPTWWIAALDPARDRMTDAAAKAARSSAKGGAPNLVFTVASIERPPAALIGTAHEVRVHLPWSALLRGVVRGDAAVMAGLRSVARDDGELVVVIGTDIWREPVPREVVGLEPLVPDDDPAGRPPSAPRLAPRYAAAGFTITAVRTWTAADAAASTGPPPAGSPGPGSVSPTSSWGRRLAAARPGAGFIELRARAGPPAKPSSAIDGAPG